MKNSIFIHLQNPKQNENAMHCLSNETTTLTKLKATTKIKSWIGNRHNHQGLIEVPISTIRQSHTQVPSKQQLKMTDLEEIEVKVEEYLDESGEDGEGDVHINDLKEETKWG